MTNQVMCFCPKCRMNTIGIKTGMSGGAIVFHLFLVLMTGFLWLPVAILCMLCSGNVRCTVCGMKARKL